jgi:V/A-type H+/Na+-transporting ATPase subunit F
MNYKIAIVGPKDAIAGFSLLGADTKTVNTGAQAVEMLYALKKEKRLDSDGIERQAYAIIFITEDFAQSISADDEKRLSKGALPAIVPVPSHKGSTGYSVQRLKRIVERAIGSDILQ